MKKIIKPVFTETVTVNDAGTEAHDLPIRKWDHAEILFKVVVDGWLFDSVKTKEEFRKMMHARLDRQLDRYKYVK